jgi:peptide/nickel transport system substrate-binding protein
MTKSTGWKPGFSRRGALKAGMGGLGLVAMPAVLRSAAKRAFAADAMSTLKVAPEVDLKIFDPVWTTATVTSTHSWMVYDTLFAIDSKYNVKPQMVDKYEASEDGLTHNFRLRDGLAFSDGTPVTSKDCIASVKRWAARFGKAKIMLDRAQSFAAIDDKSFALKLKEPFGPVLETLGNASQVCFIMREKEAMTDPFTQVTEVVGSGPFVWVKEEWQPNALVVYRKNPAYKPRSEPADGYAGGHVVRVERVEWRVTPDFAVQSAALAAGELDYLTNPLADQVRQMRSNPAITVGFLDPLGWQFHIRFNSLAKPFDNVKMREAVQMLVESRQEDYLAATGQTGDLGKTCLAPFVCGSPNETMVGTDRFAKYDPAKIKALLKEGGYNGEKIAIMDPTDQGNLHVLATVLDQHLKEVGVATDLQAMDWSSLVSRRSIKASPAEDRSGWNIFPTAWPSSTMMDPVLNAPLDSSCEQKNWFGWPCDPEMEKLRLDYLAARNADQRKVLIEKIQLRFLDQAPYAYAGQYFPPIAYRKDRIKGVQGMISPVFWNIEKFSA